MGRFIGDVRGSTPEQSVNLQLDEFNAVGSKKIFTDKISAVTAVRTGLNKCLDSIWGGTLLLF